MNRDTLIAAIEDLLEQWKQEAEGYPDTSLTRCAIQDCIDALRGILPPEDEG